MAKVEILIYKITGKQLFFTVPHAWCEECDTTIGLTKSVLQELGLENDPRVRLTIKPWIAKAFEALSFGGWHAPVLMINGKIFSQGVVPNRAKLKVTLMRLLDVTPSTVTTP